MSVLVETRKVLSSSSNSRLQFEMEQSGAICTRHVRLDDKRAYEWGITCNTCEFWFERKSGANGSVSLADVADTLNNGLEALEEATTQSIADKLPCGDYIAILTRTAPKLVLPSDVNDYFCHEQVQLWGVDPFWGLPYDPRTEYYRTGSQVFNHQTQLFEFIVPMFPHGWLKPEIVAAYKDRLGGGQRPTAVAIGFLDVKSPAVLDVKPGHTPPKVKEHWCFPSFLIDGHHKTYAAAALGTEMLLLTFLAPSQGTADASQIETLLKLLCK